MMLGTVLVLAGVWWTCAVWRRPGRRRRDFRGPLLMTGIGAALVLVWLALAGWD